MKDDKQMTPLFATFDELCVHLGIPNPVEVEKEFQRLLHAELLTVNQWRQYRGFPPINGSDVTYVPNPNLDDE